ncbi:hypothetical protein [Nostoc sp. UHCC 0252]|uniref:hypothetical protein n=1 Tax=Nostoc sp. UHCC 0252 TaxID=3110241 RepID=UPI002B2025EC|nr:hypothetical protein [Nostoc sp. UHCC 0252]MEA5601034.1 hypothetical protein [Nostoc sp. UHCC 0252]
MSNRASTNRIKKVLWDVFILKGNFDEDSCRIPNAVKTAQVIVILAAIAHASGSVIIPLLAQVTLSLLIFIFVINALSVIAGYYFWTFTIWKIGQQLRLSIPTYRELLIPIGFAHTPQIFNFFTVIPLLGRPIEIGLSIWSLLAVIVALKGWLNIKLVRAILISLSGWLIVQIAIGVIQITLQRLIIETS